MAGQSEQSVFSYVTLSDKFRFVCCTWTKDGSFRAFNRKGFMYSEHVPHQFAFYILEECFSDILRRVKEEVLDRGALIYTEEEAGKELDVGIILDTFADDQPFDEFWIEVNREFRFWYRSVQAEELRRQRFLNGILVSYKLKEVRVRLFIVHPWAHDSARFSQADILDDITGQKYIVKVER